jgi:hypothetical protein
MIDYGPQSSSDNQFTAKRRLKQSKYRCEYLHEDCGYGPTSGSKMKYGNMLIAGETTGSNFVSKCAFDYAKQRVNDSIVTPEMTIEPFRLFNNMLSSMPMCFNLFSDIRAILIDNANECSSVVKSLFREIDWIERVLYVAVEFIPTPLEKYTDDKTAFDGMILVTDKNGEKGVISIETKYTDLLGSNSSSNTKIKDQLIVDAALFDADTTKRLISNGYNQAYRNFLLTYKYAKVNKLKYFANIVISPSEDTKSCAEIDNLKVSLKSHKDCIFKIDLEEFILRGTQCESDRIRIVYSNINERYCL